MDLRRLARRLLGRPEPLSARARADALDALGGADCAVCRTANAEVKRWFFMYENETRADLELRERLERSLGFCASHTRQLLDSGAATPWLARWLFADVARAGVKAIAAGSQYRGPEPCLVCLAVTRTENDALDLIAAGLADPDVAQLLASGDGVCVRHGVALLHRRGAGAVVANALVERLGKDTSTAQRHLIGVDLDHARRRRQRQGQVDGALGGVELMLDAPCCPLCAAADRTSTGYLRWLAELGQAAEELRGEATLCADHLAELVGVRRASGQVGELTDDGLLPAVATVIDRTAELWLADLRAYRDGRGKPADVGRWISCHACSLRAAAVERERRLLGLVSATPELATRIERAHGVCLRHGLQPGLPQPWRTVLAARIALLSYALDESQRKAGWDARWEPKGGEMTAWSRAPFLLDGAILGPRSPEGGADADPQQR